MATKWQPSAKLALAIAKVEEQSPGGKLSKWGTAQHLACWRYLVHEHCDEKGKLDKAALKASVESESAFLGFASNAQKMLVDFGSIPKGAASYSEYE